ncbi:hypothetical protein OIY81_1451 [Cryptosporidium canis]|nr:hypothetical protein OIY81_1451 [Cryptosporidium canis]
MQGDLSAVPCKPEETHQGDRPGAGTGETKAANTENDRHPASGRSIYRKDGVQQEHLDRRVRLAALQGRSQHPNPGDWELERSGDFREPSRRGSVGDSPVSKQL